VRNLDDWSRQAACQTTDQELFLPVGTMSTALEQEHQAQQIGDIRRSAQPGARRGIGPRVLRFSSSLTALASIFAVLLAGCGVAGRTEAAQTVREFQRQVALERWTGACSLLSTQTRAALEFSTGQSCAQALSTVRLPVGDVGNVEVWGRHAGVMVGEAAVYLSWLSGRWQVVAAGCTPQGAGRPYRCSLGRATAQ
jgi:hypothetical protein